MIRKTLLALAAIGTVGAAALAPTSASAWGIHHGWGHNWGLGFYGPGYVRYYDDCYWVKRVNRHGVVRMYKVCN